MPEMSLTKVSQATGKLKRDTVPEKFCPSIATMSKNGDKGTPLQEHRPRVSLPIFVLKKKKKTFQHCSASAGRKAAEAKVKEWTGCASRTPQEHRSGFPPGPGNMFVLALLPTANLIISLMDMKSLFKIKKGMSGEVHIWPG